MTAGETVPPSYWIDGRNPYEVTLNEALRYPDSVAVLEGDDGGETYVVSPVRFIRCDEHTLLRLLRDLDAIEWPHNQEDMAHLLFARALTDRPENERPAGIWQTTEVRVNERLTRRGLEPAVRAVLAGERPALGA